MLAAVGVRLSAQQQPVTSSNVNMVSWTTFPDGDPCLQRQNELNAAVSTRNPLHLLAGANGYRTVDLPSPFDPVRGFKMSADAWVGLFKSVDDGQNWKSTLLPGFPQGGSPEGLASPIRGREGATDPTLRIRDSYGGRRISGELPVSRPRRASWPAGSTAAPGSGEASRGCRRPR